MPAISVLMPVYNGERYVEDAVRSVLSQTFDDFELLIIDDGSKDRSLAILQRLAASDRRIQLESRPNAGLVVTLNQLIERASADIVARMDADDICRATRFEKQWRYMTAHPECVALGSRCLFIDPEGLPLYEFCDHYAHDEVDAVLMRPDIGLLHPSVMMQRSTVIAAGGYTTQFPHVEDLDLFLRMGELGKLANLPEVLIDYRVHATSVTHTHPLQQHVAGLKAVKAACARRRIPFHRDGDIEQPSFPFQSQLAMYRKWAWCALGAGNLRSARKHALRAMALSPMSVDSIRLLACTLRGH